MDHNQASFPQTRPSEILTATEASVCLWLESTGRLGPPSALSRVLLLPCLVNPAAKLRIEVEVIFIQSDP